MNNWPDYYKYRVNSTYQNYFEGKYKVMLDFVGEFETIREEGIGIGSISKYLLKKGVKTYGFDICPQMVSLCKENNPSLNVYVDDIFKPQKEKVDMVVTHGVLEHFNDEQILHIIDRYKSENQSSIHYVPIDGYKVPSFGDERLLSVNYWVKTFNPTWFINIKDEDLYLIFENE